ncbi:MAG TPA: pseudouridine synthase [Gammaproteobacteria bacterium]
MSKERIQKALARQGLGSRRQIEGWISDGAIQLNGKPVKLGDTVKTGDEVILNGRRIIIKEVEQTLPKVIVYNKPEGEVCTRSDPEGRPTIFEQLPKLWNGRWIAVGRLDINTSGLILLTDNGDLANRLMHPSLQVEREYAVRTLGKATEEMLYKVTHGVELEDGMARFEEVTDTHPEATSVNHWYYVVLMEGRNREVRRIWEAVGLKVSRLKRVRYGPIMMTKGHGMGQVRELGEKDIIQLGALVGLDYAVKKPEVEQAKSRTKKYDTRKTESGKTGSGKAGNKPATKSRVQQKRGKPPRA